jgi:hypothetical protein
MESGRVSLVMEDFALADVMREATAMFVHASQTKGIRMSLRLDPTCPETIHTDKVITTAPISNQLLCITNIFYTFWKR